MRLTTTTNVSVDGVMQGLGGPDEDRSGGFDRGGWAIPLIDTEAGDYLNQVYGGAAAFLFGRRTYEIFAGYWGAMADPSTNPIAAALNSRRPKYVASTSLADPQWAGTSVLTGDIATAIGDLKAQHDGELLVPGSGALVRWLFANDLVDQLDLVTSRRRRCGRRRCRRAAPCPESGARLSTTSPNRWVAGPSTAGTAWYRRPDHATRPQAGALDGTEPRRERHRIHAWPGTGWSSCSPS